MRAAVLVEKGRIEVRSIPDPVPGPHEVVIAVEAAGICGTDLALLSGDYETALPLVPGHEFCGSVLELGAGVPEDWLGARVTAEINVSCLSLRDESPCAACRRDLARHCLRRRVIGLKGLDGALAERIRVPVASLHRLPEGLPASSAVIVELLASAIRTFDLTPVEPGQTVVVLGTGRLGLLITHLARSRGARVLALDPQPSRRELAVRFGAQNAFSPDDPEFVQVFADTTGGLGADVVVECTGRPDGIGRAVSLVRPRGVVAVKTTCGRPGEGFPVTDLVVREITLQGSRCGPFPEAIERLAAGQVPVADFVAGTFPLERIHAAFAAAAGGNKVLVTPT